MTPRPFVGGGGGRRAGPAFSGRRPGSSAVPMGWCRWCRDGLAASASASAGAVEDSSAGFAVAAESADIGVRGEQVRLAPGPALRAPDRDDAAGAVQAQAWDER